MESLNHMRTTLSVDDDVLELTRNLADQRKMSLSDAFNYLVKRGLNAAVPTRDKNGFAVFDIGGAAPRFGPDDVARAIESEDAELLQSFKPSFTRR
jgi:hypothetical protein